MERLEQKHQILAFNQMVRENRFWITYNITLSNETENPL